MSSHTNYTPSTASTVTLVDSHGSSAWCLGGCLTSKSLSREKAVAPVSHRARVADKCKLVMIFPALKQFKPEWLWRGWNVLDLLRLICVGVHSERTTRQAWGIFFMAIGHEGWKVVSDALTELSESEARSFVHKLITRGQSGWLTGISSDDEPLSPTDSTGNQQSSTTAGILWLFVDLMTKSQPLIEGILTPTILSNIIQANLPIALVASNNLSLTPLFASLAGFHPLAKNPTNTSTLDSIELLKHQFDANPTIRCMLALLNLRSSPTQELKDIVDYVIRYLTAIDGETTAAIIRDYGAIFKDTSPALPFLYISVALLSTLEPQVGIPRPFSENEAFIDVARQVCEDQEFRKSIFRRWGIVNTPDEKTSVTLCRIILFYVRPAFSSSPST